MDISLILSFVTLTFNPLEVYFQGYKKLLISYNPRGGE